MGEKEEKIRTPQQERSIRTKEAIVRAAMKLFSEKGYHQTNTKEIAAARPRRTNPASGRQPAGIA